MMWRIHPSMQTLAASGIPCKKLNRQARVVAGLLQASLLSQTRR